MVLEFRIFKFNGTNYGTHKKHNVIVNDEEEINRVNDLMKKLDNDREYKVRVDDVSEEYIGIDELTESVNSIIGA